MNKKILSIFALIMALSFAVSCSNSDTTGTGGNNGGGNPTAVTKDTIATAVKGALGATLEIKDTPNNMSTDNTVVTLGDGTIDITITDESFTTAEDGNKTTTLASLTAKAADFKNALTSQGLIVGTEDITFTDGGNSTVTFTVTVGGATISSTDTDSTKYTLPTELKDKASITITLKLVLGTSGTWA